MLEATIHLIKGNADEILELINERKKRRLETQPLEYPSAGSVFRNPKDDYAGRLIEEIGYKGKNDNSFYYRRTGNFHIPFFENIRNHSLNKIGPKRLLKKYGNFK